MTDRQPKIPEEYPGVAQSDRGEEVTGIDTTQLDGGECLLRVWTTERDEPLELALTPTQVRQWDALFNIEAWRVDVCLVRDRPDLDDTVLVSTIGKSFHDPQAESCAAVNAYDTAIDHETTVAEAVDGGYRPCRHCYEMDDWGPDELIDEVRLRE